MTTKITSDNIEPGSISSASLSPGINLGGSAVPKITNIQVTDSSYVVLDDTAVDTAGGYIKITGTDFVSGCNILIGTVPVTSVTYVSSTEIRAQVPATVAGTYIVYLVNPDGGVAIRINGITFSGVPSWITDSALPGGDIDSAISIQFSANAATAYSLAAGSTLPTGLTLSNVGLLSGSVTGLASDTTYNFTILATDAELQDSPRTFSITITSGDAYFNQTSLLLQADVTPFNSDASTNAFAVTINGDTKPNNFNPYTPGYYSAYFDGSGDSLTVPSAANAAFNPANGFTVEGWVYFTSNPSFQFIVSSAQGAGSFESYWFVGTTSGGNWRVSYGGASAVDTGVPIVFNIWTHFALSCTSTNARLFINGIQIGTATVTQLNANMNLIIGVYAGGAQYYLNGYLSNLRFVQGQQLYSSNFTPPSEPLTAVTNTSLLACQSNRFIDTSTNNFAITRNGDTKISSFIPYTPSSSYLGRGSVYFDGTGDDLDVPSSVAFAFGTGDFTVEGWVYITATSGTIGFFRNGSDNLNLQRNSSGNLEAWDGSTFSSSSPVTSNTWHHVAWTRSSGTARIYLNGTQVLTWSQGVNYTATTFRIGATGGSYQNKMFGYISNLRIVKGTALYTSNFTPPAEPLAAVAGTSLLTLQTNQPNTNSVFLDSSTNNFVITRAGDTTQGSFSPYGANWSNYFDGTDYLTVDDNANLQFGTSPFTIECWIYISTAGTQTIVCKGSDSNTGWLFRVNSSNQLVFISGSTLYTYTTQSVILNSWNHVVCMRTTNNEIILAVNGLLSESLGTVSANYNQTNLLSIGAGRPTSYLNRITGYISNLRIVKGTAIYTANFTPPTSPLTAIAGTSLLTCQSNRFVDASANNFAITRVGDVRVERFGPFPATTVTPRYSAYFDGNGDYLQAGTVSSFNFMHNTSALFTLECWVYLTATKSHFIFGNNGTSTVNIGASVYTSSTNQIVLLIARGVSLVENAVISVFSTGTVPINTWTHVAVTYDQSLASNNAKIYINGTLDTQGTKLNNTPSSANASFVATIGATNTGTLPLSGYINNLRITNNIVYTANFTPPAEPLTAVAGTSLLTCQSDRLIDNSTNAFAITAVGDARPTTFAPFAPVYTSKQSYTPATYGGSGYFDGTGDYLDTGVQSDLYLNGTDYTIECWVYFTRMPGSANAGTLQPVMAQGDGAWFGNANAHNWYLLFESTIVNFGKQPTPYIAAYTPVLNAWTHVAVVGNSSGSITVYINGTSLGTQTSRTALGSASWSTRLGLGHHGDTKVANYFQGYIANARIVKGTQVYTSNFVPPAAPLASITNTSLLVNFTDAGIADNTGLNVISTVGNAQTSTVVKKYGTGSMYFDGNGDGIFIPSSTTLARGASNFTIEFWYHPTSTAGTNPNIMCNNNGSGSFVSGQWSLHAPHSAYPNKYSFWVASFATNSALLVSSSNISTNVWTHITVTRSGNTWRLFINGTIESTGTHSGVLDNGGSYPQFIGYQPNVESGRYITGYIDDLRMTNGIARYTANFTPPSGPLQSK